MNDPLLQREAHAWDRVQPDPSNPQIWHDPKLFGMFFGSEYQWLVDRAIACGPEILELGCGEGRLAIRLAERGCRVTGIDLSPGRIERADAFARRAGVHDRVTFRTGDLNAVDLEPGRYSCIVAHDALHHVHDLRHLFTQVRSALAPGGRLLVMDYRGMGRLRRLAVAFLYAVLPTVKPYRDKWRLRSRLRGFLAGEEQKRADLARGGGPALHEESPFEEISQSSLPRLLHEMFIVERYETLLPFWFYLAPKLLIPRRARYPLARFFRIMDAALSALGVPGAHFVLEARSPHASTSD